MARIKQQGRSSNTKKLRNHNHCKKELFNLRLNAMDALCSG
ncbi:hypothetical protein SynSYN20_02907 [Synechococcus sp. SYN20]|nr:hypothetical protein SynSYN20_02907 [Synechococcus sp. SYN20]